VNNICSLFYDVLSIVTYTSTARQRFDKHVPAETDSLVNNPLPGNAYKIRDNRSSLLCNGRVFREVRPEAI
jgi:hypothetical protein